LEEGVDLTDPVLVATDGGRTAANALRFAAAYAGREGVPIEIVSVVEPLTDVPMPLPHRGELEQANARGVADRVREHLRDVVGPVSWPIHVRIGRPAPAICQVARERNARVIVLGVEPKKADGNATAVELIQLAEKPVLTAPGTGLPHTAIVGVDFRRSSSTAAREALRLVGPDGTLHLVHVRPSLDFPAASVWDWEQCYGFAVASGFQRIVNALGGEARIERHTVDGDPVSALLEKADELDADLLAIGSDGYTCRGRVVIGRVAQRLVRESTVAVLATPVPPGLEMEIAPAAVVSDTAD
jgi:nucleotide-binding universal stress UspA family protein